MKRLHFIMGSLLYALVAFLGLAAYGLQCGMAFPDEDCVRRVDRDGPFVIAAVLLIYIVGTAVYWIRRLRDPDYD